MAIKHPVRLALVTAAALLLTGCAGGSGAKQSPTDSAGKPLTPVVIGIAPAAAYVPIMYGVDNGFFTDQGLSATTEIAPGGAALVPAMQSGSIQIGGSNLLSVLQAQEKGLDMKCVSGAYESNTSALIGSPKTGSGIKTGSDLEGKTLGVNAVGSVNQLVAEKWVKENDGDPSKVKFVAVGFPDQASALESGQIDAAITDEPFTTAMKNKNYPVIDEHPSSVIAPDVTFGCWIGLGDWLKGHGPEVKAFQAAGAKVNKYLLDNPKVFREALVKYLKVTQEVASDVVLPKVTTDLSIDDLKAWQEAAIEFGFLKGPIDLAKVDGGYSKQ